MTSETSRTERLVQNRNSFKQAGFTGPLLKYQDLSYRERQFLITDWALSVRVSWAEFLHSWGVMCSHADGSEPRFAVRGREWFDCCLCGTRVIV